MAERHHFGESEEMYLKTVFVLAESIDPVPVTALAERLGITTVSASEMVGRLQDRSLLDHTPYKGVRLTPDGEGRARDILRRHRLWERFLTDRLQMDWAQAHDAACQLEHLGNEAIIDALDNYLDWPETCPHGNPIPRPGREAADPAGVTLGSLQAGEAGIVLSVHIEDRALLTQLERNGLGPGSAFVLRSVTPQGDRVIQVEGESHTLDDRVAGRTIVRRDTDRA